AVIRKDEYGKGQHRRHDQIEPPPALPHRKNLALITAVEPVRPCHQPAGRGPVRSGCVPGAGAAQAVEVGRRAPGRWVHTEVAPGAGFPALARTAAPATASPATSTRPLTIATAGTQGGGRRADSRPVRPARLRRAARTSRWRAVGGGTAPGGADAGGLGRAGSTSASARSTADASGR